MGNVTLQLERKLLGDVGPAENVIFDIIPYSAGNINYDNTTGIITFNETGRYIVNWIVVLKSSSYANGVVLTLISSEGTEITGNTNVKSGQITGMGVIEIITAPATLSLKNTTNGSYYYSDRIPIKASLIVKKDDTAAEPTNMYCFAVSQLIHVLSQMITTYATNTWTVYSESLSNYSGVPLDLYTAPDAVNPGLLRLVDINGDYEIIPIENITAIYPGDGTVYNPEFTYLTPPDPLPVSCDSDMLAAIQSYLVVGTTVEMRLGPAVSASGDVYRNEFGVIVLSDTDGNTPVFIASPKILRIFITGNPPVSKQPVDSKKPKIEIIKNVN